MKKLYQCLMIGSRSRFHVYVVAKDEKDAMEKAKKKYPYYSVSISENMGEVIV